MQLEPEVPREPMVSVQSEFKGQEPRALVGIRSNPKTNKLEIQEELMFLSSSLRQGKTDVPC